MYMIRKQLISNLLLKAEKDVATAHDMYKAGHYDWCLFIWHLAIEKMLKVTIMREEKEIEFTHNLSKLAKSSNITFDDEIYKQLQEITTFNIAARYDDYKLSFYKKANKIYTAKWIKICESIYKLLNTNNGS